MKDYNIDMIYALTETEAAALATECRHIKGHNIYFVDFGGYFGFSALVFNNDHHIYYADDFELHHNGKTADELRDYYIESLNNKLFTDDEIKAPIKEYDEYSRKSYFLHNYYGMRYDHVSMFFIVTPESEKEHKKAIEGMTMNPVSFSYMKDRDAIKHMVALANELAARRTESEKSYDYLKSAFKYEMFNHEYAINWQGNWDVLSCFGNIEYIDGDSYLAYFDQLNFDETQRKAYRDARQEYFNYCDEHELF